MSGYWHSLQRDRISRRRLLKAAGAGAVALAATGLATGAGPAIPALTKKALAGGPLRGGTLKLSNSVDWGTLDPVTSVAGGPSVFPRIYNSLLDRSRRQPDFFYFDLAEEIEQPDEETFIFKIRPGVRIAPNNLGIEERDLDALDVKRWFDRIADDTRAVIRAFTNEWLTSVDATDLRTVTLRTRGPYAYTLFRIGAPLGGCIPPREFFERDISIESQGAGAGPFGSIQPGSFHEQGGITINRNLNYYRKAATGGRLPYFDRIEFVRISDRFPRRVAFLGRQIHVYDAENRYEVDGLLNDMPDAQVIEEPVNTFISFVMHPERPPWNDARIRKAALYALNRQEFADLIVGPGGGRPNGLVHWPLGDFALPPDELAELQPYDPARSRALILEATGSDSIDIDVSYPVTDIEFHNRHLPIFLSQMRDAGFNVQDDARDFGEWLRSYQNLEYNSSLALNQIYETPEIPLDFHSAAGPQGDRNFAVGIGGIYPEVEAAIMASKTEFDPADQVEAVRNAQRVIYENGPAFLPIMSWTGFTMYHSFIKNVRPGLGTTGLYLTPQWWLGEEGRTNLTGDANCDGNVTSVDAAVVLQRDAGLLDQASCDKNADANRDGSVNSLDAAAILQYEAGLLPALPP